MTHCSICAWSPEQRNQQLIFETSFWRIILVPNQSLLGRCYVNLRRHAATLSQLQPAEVEDWLRVVQRLEKGITHAFGPTMFNWQCNLNFAYREKPANPHVHWYANPRYAQVVSQFGYTFNDPDFGSPYQTRIEELPIDILEQIANRIKECVIE